MSKLTIHNNGQYRNKKGTLVFRYTVKGKPDALKAYEEAQGEYYTEDSNTGEPLYFTSRFCGKTCDLIVTDEGKIYPDMSELEQQASLVAQFGGNLGQSMADEIARKLTGRGSSANRAVAKSSDEDADNNAEEGIDGNATPAKPAVRRVARK